MTAAYERPADFDAMWEDGFRPYEIYLFNDSPIDYGGKVCPAGTVAGWYTDHVFAKRDELTSYPFFDAVIGLSNMTAVTATHAPNWKG